VYRGYAVVSPENEKAAEAVSVLSFACSQNLSLTLRVLSERSVSEYMSKFLEFDRDAQDHTFVIEAPTLKGSIVPLRPGQKVRVSFVHNGQNRSFESEVAGRGKFRLNPAVIVPSLRLDIPDSVSSGEKRSFYRVSVTNQAPREVKLAILAGDERGKRIRARAKGSLTDIGGGGLGFRMPEGKSLLLGLGTRVRMSFQIPSDDEVVTLLGRICFSLRLPKAREAFFGVQFIEVDSEIEYKKGIDRILRYIAEQQRRTVKRQVRPNR